MLGAVARVTIVAAIDYQGAICKTSSIPWDLPAALERLKKITEDGVVVMGRKTYESILSQLRPLNDRPTWVITRDRSYSLEQCHIIRNAQEFLLKASGREAFVVGGEETYRSFWRYAERLILIHVKTVVKEANTFFPEIPTNLSQTLLYRQEADDSNKFPFSIVEYNSVPVK